MKTYYTVRAKRYADIQWHRALCLVASRPHGCAKKLNRHAQKSGNNV